MIRAPRLLDCPATPTPGNGLEWQFGTVSDEPEGCSFYNSCVSVKIHADQACSGVYIEGKVLDGNGTIIGMTNATVPSMSAGDDSVSRLGYVGKGAATTRVTQVACE